MYSRAIGNGRCHPASMAVIHADKSSSVAAVGAGLTVGRPAVSLVSQKENPVGPGCGRQAGAAMSDALVFGGVCDRCGQPYVQRCFPHGCLCSSCYYGYWLVVVTPDRRDV
jgi:hypothetical protein